MIFSDAYSVLSQKKKTPSFVSLSNILLIKVPGKFPSKIASSSIINAKLNSRLVKFSSIVRINRLLQTRRNEKGNISLRLSSRVFLKIYRASRSIFFFFFFNYEGHKQYFIFDINTFIFD